MILHLKSVWAVQSDIIKKKPKSPTPFNESPNLSNKRLTAEIDPFSKATYKQIIQHIIANVYSIRLKDLTINL